MVVINNVISWGTDMPNTIVRKRAMRAEQLREGMLVDFEDGEPDTIKDVKHLTHKVLFTARGCEFALERDEMIQTVFMMRVVG